MAIRPIITIPDPRLKLVSEPVAVVDASVRALADDKLETMYDAPGIGLAAIQIGVAKRVLVIDLAKEGEARQPMVFINPEIVWSSEEESVYEEGCLSIPEYYAEVTRPASIKVKFRDEKGEEQELEADGLLATCLQHEIDHLDGIVFVDHLSRLKRERVMKKFQKQEKLRGRYGSRISIG